MSHPYAAHHERKVGHERAKKLMHAAHGGKVHHSDEAQDRALIKKMMHEESSSKVPGRKGAQRFARGGKVKHHGNVNIAVVVPHRGSSSADPPPLAAAPAGPAALPPSAAAGPALPPPMGAGAPMRPPGMKRGGHIDGEMPKNEGRWKGYAAEHSHKPNRARGGRIPKMTAGAQSGVGRLEQEKAMRHKGR